MGIPTTINRLGLGATSSSGPIAPVISRYGVFLFNRNSSATSSAMTMTSAPLTYYANAYQRIWNRGSAVGTIINSSCQMYVYSGGRAFNA